MTQYFKIREKNSGCLKPPGLRQACSSPPSFFCGSLKDAQSGCFRLRGGKGLPISWGPLGSPELQQPGAGLPPGRAGPCGAAPNCCRLQPLTAASPRGQICTCSSPGEQTGSHAGLSQQHQNLPPLCLSPAGGRRFVHPWSPCWGSAQLSAQWSLCWGQECCPFWSLTHRLLGTTGNSRADCSE